MLDTYSRSRRPGVGETLCGLRWAEERVPLSRTVDLNLALLSSPHRLASGLQRPWGQSAPGRHSGGGRLS